MSASSSISQKPSNWRWFHWLDADTVTSETITTPLLQFKHWMPFLYLHIGCLSIIWTGTSWFSVLLAFSMYWFRMFAVTGLYHRYFSHRTFKTSRFMQFIFGVWTMTSMQRGPLWWAAHHRHHHQTSDQPEDWHSPTLKGLFHSHLGWMTLTENLVTDYNRVKDLAKFPELVFLNRFDWLVPLLYILSMYALGEGVNHFFPGLHTNGWQCVAWGFFVGTTILLHGTCTINSLAHIFGSRRYDTGDTSRNNLWLALITMGEGWHNNHHKYQGSVRQGFFWWEIDVTFYILKVMSWLGLIYDLNPIPKHAYENL